MWWRRKHGTQQATLLWLGKLIKIHSPRTSFSLSSFSQASELGAAKKSSSLVTSAKLSSRSSLINGRCYAERGGQTLPAVTQPAAGQGWEPALFRFGVGCCLLLRCTVGPHGLYPERTDNQLPIPWVKHQTLIFII